jgi:hypothetical protein
VKGTNELRHEVVLNQTIKRIGKDSKNRYEASSNVKVVTGEGTCGARVPNENQVDFVVDEPVNQSNLRRLASAGEEERNTLRQKSVINEANEMNLKRRTRVRDEKAKSVRTGNQLNKKHEKDDVRIAIRSTSIELRNRTKVDQFLVKFRVRKLRE